MAVLRLEDGRTFVRREVINEIIAPAAVEAVPVPGGLDDLLARRELSPPEIAALLDAGADPGLAEECRRVGWPPPLAQVFWPGMPARLEEQLASFGPPHTNPAGEIHHVLDGAVIFGVVCTDGSQAIVVVQPGDALRIYEGVEHWSTLTADHRVKTVLYLSRPPGYAHAYTNTRIRVR